MMNLFENLQTMNEITTKHESIDDYFDKLLEDAGIMEDFSTKLVMDNNSNKESRTLNLSRAKRD